MCYGLEKLSWNSTDSRIFFFPFPFFADNEGTEKKKVAVYGNWRTFNGEEEEEEIRNAADQIWGDKGRRRGRERGIIKGEKSLQVWASRTFVGTVLIFAQKMFIPVVIKKLHCASFW